jgi:thymidylate kinase (EC 2.7.4.9)
MSALNPYRPGLFVSLEGIDGAGKSTQLQTVVDVLRAANRQVMLTREPGGTEIGEKIRELLLHETMRPATEALLMFAARQEHVLRVIEPALLGGTDVVCDRFTAATLAYQGGGKGIPTERLERSGPLGASGAVPGLHHPDRCAARGGRAASGADAAARPFRAGKR